MNTNTSKIQVTELDFDFIKQELITYFQSQEEFSDYNFEGSSLNVIMDILANNTHMNAYMANMLANEAFLDSSSIRQSTVSKAKEIGYTPRSVRSSIAPVNIYINNVAGNPQQILMPAGTIFDTNFKYTFATKEDYTLYPSENDNTTYEVMNVNLYDGNYINFHYTVNNADPDQSFIIPSDNVDMTTLRVFVQPDSDSTQIEEYFLNDDLTRLKPDSKVFFTHETPEGFYEVTFGDGILGQNVINGNYITLTYIIAKGREEANNIVKYIPIVDISGYGSIVVETIEPSYGGSEKETLEDIKFLAPKMYQSQKRAVTTQDYETFLLHDYPWIDTINSWGGEYNDPPIYGKVFFAIKPKHTEFVSTKLKEEMIQHLIKKYNVVTIVPEIIDPDYIYVGIDSEVFYTPSRTVLSESTLENMVITEIYKYFNDTTQKFKMDYLFSPMTARIDGTDKSFDSSLTDITLHKRIYPITNLSQTFELKFNNALIPGSIESSHFNITDSINSNVILETIIKDDSKGKMVLIYVNSGVVLNTDIGTVDYEKGVISITILPYTLPLDTLDVRLYCRPVSKNIVSGYNQIILPDNSSVNYDVNRKQGVSVKITSTEIKKG
jgi:hypothetical protein